MFKRSYLSTAITAAMFAVPINAVAQEATDSEDGAVVVEEVIVTGIRSSLTKALELKRDNLQIVDSIVAEDIGKFPDNNVVEALQRVTGVQVTDRASGEVNTVYIRGLNDISTTINGRSIFTSTGRSVALADIPASLLSRADVYKTRSANLIEGGIAGQIDVVTHRPLDFDGFQVNAGARGVYQSNSEETDPSLSLLVSNKWDVSDGGEFGALLNVSYVKTYYRDQNIWIGSLDPYKTTDYTRISGDFYEVGTVEGISSAPGSTIDINGVDTEYYLLRDAMGFTDFVGERERPAANVSLQFAPNENSEYLFEAFYNGYRNESFNSLVFINTNNAAHFREPELYEGTNVIKTNYVSNPYMFTSGDGGTGKTDSYVYALGGKWDIGEKLHLESEFLYQESTFERSFVAQQTEDVRDRLVVDFNEGGTGLPLVYFPDDPDTAADESDLTNAADWTLTNFFDNGGKDEGDSVTWTFDGEYLLEWGGIEKVVFGVRYDDRGATSISRDQGAGCADVDNTGRCSATNPELAGIANVSKAGFFDDRAHVPSQWFAADGFYLLDNLDDIRAFYGIDGPSDDIASLTFNVQEQSTAFYLQAEYYIDIGGQELSGEFGVRAIQTKSELSFDATSAESDDTVVLPSFMIKYDLTDDLLMRLSYGETIRRPGFGDLNPTMTLTPPAEFTNAEYGFASSGNPELEPVEATNYDLALEWYFAESSSLYGVLFRRDVEGFVFGSSNAIEITDHPIDEFNAKYILTQPDNSGKGYLEGAEVGFQYFPEGLPDWLDGLGMQASYTYIDGETQDPIFEEDEQLGPQLVGYTTNPLVGVSTSSYSAVLSYERDTFDMRLSYVYRDEFLGGYNSNFAMPSGIYRNPEKNLDFQISYDVTDQIVVTFDATNLTNEIFKSYYTDPYLYNNGASIYSRTYALGIRYNM